MVQSEPSEKDIARVRMCWEQITARRLTAPEQVLFAEKLRACPELVQYRSEHLRAFSYAALEGWGIPNKVLRFGDWLASLQQSRARKQTPWAHAACVVSYTAKSAYKHRAAFNGVCGKCGKEIKRGDRIAHSY